MRTVKMLNEKSPLSTLEFVENWSFGESYTSPVSLMPSISNLKLVFVFHSKICHLEFR